MSEMYYENENYLQQVKQDRDSLVKEIETKVKNFEMKHPLIKVVSKVKFKTTLEKFDFNNI